LEHGEEGYLHLEEMIKHLELGLKSPDATPEFKREVRKAIEIGQQALMAYDEALNRASEALGRPATSGPPEGSEHEGSGMR
jgi:hypothetical protein